MGEPSDAASTESSWTENPQAAAAVGRFSLHRLSAAFARLTGSDQAEAATDTSAGPPPSALLPEAVPVLQVGLSPRMIVEGMLFVGHGDGRPLTSREIAAHIRDVSPEDVDAIVVELNEIYDHTGTSYYIASEGPGYRMRLRDEMETFRQRFGGRVRQVRLTAQAIEVMSIVAYKQPVTAEEVQRVRGGRSDGQLNQLVRRGLLSLHRGESGGRPFYRTTERFNQLFQLASLKDLPKSEDLDDN